MKTFLHWFFTSEASWHASTPDFKGPPAFLLFLFVLAIYSAIWVAKDAGKRGKSEFVAVLFILLLYWPVSILFWRWLRPPISVPPALPKTPAM
jgi:hypothetical protein